MFGVNCFGKHCSCHFQGGYEVGQVLEALCRQAGSGEINLVWRSGLLSYGRWLRKGGDGILRGGDEGGSGDHVGQERICSDYVEGSGGCSSATRFEEVMVDQPF
jgi:hypothetical protein